jgi:hypothetical protein
MAIDCGPAWRVEERDEADGPDLHVLKLSCQQGLRMQSILHAIR